MKWPSASTIRHASGHDWSHTKVSNTVMATKMKRGTVAEQVSDLKGDPK